MEIRKEQYARQLIGVFSLAFLFWVPSVHAEQSTSTFPDFPTGQPPQTSPSSGSNQTSPGQAHQSIDNGPQVIPKDTVSSKEKTNAREPIQRRP